MSSNSSQHWWGRYPVEEGQSLQRRIGPALISIERRAGEWMIAQTGPGSDVNGQSGPLDFSKADRFVAELRSFELVLGAALADRPVVTSPKQPLHIMPRTRVTIFASTPLWVQVRAGDTTMLDAAIDRPSDTWFGPTTNEGELCYATLVSCRLRLEDIQTPSHRAVTTMSVNNDTDAPLHLKQVKLPVTHLQLYSGTDGRIWTEDVTLSRSEGKDDFATVDLVGAAPRFAGEVEKLADARTPGGGGTVMRVFSSLFSIG